MKHFVITHNANHKSSTLQLSDMVMYKKVLQDLVRMFSFFVQYPPSHPGTSQKYPPTTVDSKVHST